MKQIIMLALMGLQVLLVQAVNVEHTDSIYVLGWPKDALTNEPVIDDTKVELMTTDSVIIATAVPVWNEQYRAGSYFSLIVGMRSGDFIIRITNPEYQTFEKDFKLKVGKREGNFSLGQLRLRRKPKVYNLDEVTVSATKIKFYTKNDTIIYNADAFNLAEGSMLDALVSQLPGAELKRDGRIFVNGKQIESLLLNGNDFFRNDHSVLLDNLPAYTVKNIKVYNKQNEFDEHLSQKVGHKVNDGSYVMDVVLKREYQIGWLNNVEVGGGTQERWLARLFSLRYTPQSRISFYANANNIHENRKPGDSGEWSPADIGSGINTTKSGGLDYRVNDKLDRWRVEGNATASHSITDTETQQSHVLFQNSGNTFSRNLQSGKEQYMQLSTNHKFQFNLGPERSRHDIELRFSPNFNFTRGKSSFESLAAEFSELPSNIENWQSIFFGPEADQKLTSTIVNKVTNRQRNNSTNIVGGTSARLNALIPYTPYIIGFDASVNAKNSKNNSFDFYNMLNATGRDYRSRYFNRPSNHQDALANISLITPFDQNWNWVATTQLGYSYSQDKREESLYRLDRLEEMSNADLGTLPSTRDALIESLDGSNSYFTTNEQHQVTLSFDGRYDNQIYRDNSKYARFRFTWKAGVALQNENLGYEGQQFRNDHRTAWLPSLGLELLRNTPGLKHELELQTSFRQQLPSMFTLMGLRFDTDPLNIRVGNACLHRTDVFSAVFFYRSDRWLSKHRRSLSANIKLNAYCNAVATAQTYNASTGVRSFRPENLNGNWNSSMTTSFYTPLGNHGFSLNVSLSENFYHNVDLTGLVEQTPARSSVCTNYLSLPVKVDYSRNKVRLGARIQTAWNHVESHRVGFQKINAADISMGVNGNVTLPWDLQFASDLTYFVRRGYSNDAMNTDDLVWNAQLSKSIIHGKLTFALVGYDILGQLSNISYTVNAQGSTEIWRNVIPRYGMLRVIYHFNKQPKKRE